MNEGHVRLSCNHPFLNAYNPTIMLATRSNHDVRLIGTGPAAVRSIKYVENYATKGEIQANGMWKEIVDMLAKAPHLSALEARENLEDRSRLLVVKLLHAGVRSVRRSGVWVATDLLRLPDHYVTHKFVDIYPRQLLKLLPPLRDRNDIDQEDSDGDEDRPLNNDRPDSDLGVLRQQGEQFEVDNTEIMAASKSYLFRPAQLEGLCPYDFFSMWKKIKGAVGNRGRNLLERFPLLNDHPQCQTHCIQKLRLRHVPVCVGQSIPAMPRDDATEEIRERYSRFVLAIFCPWRKPEDLLQHHATFREALQQRILPQHVQAILLNATSQEEGELEILLLRLTDPEGPGLMPYSALEIHRKSCHQESDRFHSSALRPIA